MKITDVQRTDDQPHNVLTAMALDVMKLVPETVDVFVILRTKHTDKWKVGMGSRGYTDTELLEELGFAAEAIRKTKD